MSSILTNTAAMTALNAIQLQFPRPTEGCSPSMMLERKLRGRGRRPLGTGEAVVSVLAPDGRPAPVVATRLVPPASRMAPLTAAEFQAELAQGDLQREYGTPVDRESAHEMLARRMAEAKPAEPKATGRGRGAGKTIVATMAGTLAATFGRTIAREVARDLMGMLGLKGGRGTTRRR